MIEDVVDKIKTILQANLPAKLDAIDTARGGGITLQDISNTNYYIAPTHKPAVFPALYILGDNTPAVNLVSRRREFNHEIDIVVYERDTSTDNLQKRLWRYVEAIEDVLNSDLTLGNTVINTVITSHGYTDVELVHSTAHLYEKGAGLSLTVLERISM